MRRYITILFGPIGDALMAFALFDHLLTLEPHARILVLVRTPSSFISALAAQYPQVEVRQIPNGTGFFVFILSLLKDRWNLMVLGVAGIYSTPLRFFFLLLSLRPGNRTVGFNDRTPPYRYLLPLWHVLQWDPHKLMYYNLGRLLPYVSQHATDTLPPPRVRLPQEPIPNFPFEVGKFFVVHCFSNTTRRSWPSRRWKGLLAQLETLYPDYGIVLTTGPQDLAAVSDIASTLRSPYLLMPLGQTAWALEHAALFIGVDTGITHMAGVMQQKSLVISHYSYPIWQPTYNPNARAIVNGTRCSCDEEADTCRVEEEGKIYRRCSFDLSDACILKSVELALSSTERHVPLFVGFVDEECQEDHRKNNRQQVPHHHTPKTAHQDAC